MGFSSAVQWWEESQMRVLVLGSLVVQWFLFASAIWRKSAIPFWFRTLIWLAYLGSDALAIYALAALFNRHKKQDYCSSKSNSILEVVWAPILLMHLGGQDTITAYNIEDNELWRRHVLTSVSQVIVAIYVFCKSWPGGDKKLLQAAILLFTPGILKCFEKPWALKSASINSLVSSSDSSASEMACENEISSLEEYVKKVREFVLAKQQHHEKEEGNTADIEAGHLPRAQREDHSRDLEADHLPQSQGEGVRVELEPDLHRQNSRTWTSQEQKTNAQEEGDAVNLKADNLPQTSSTSTSKRREEFKKRIQMNREARKLFVDHASPYSDRLDTLRSFWVKYETQAYHLLQERISNTFDLLYTKAKMNIFVSILSGGSRWSMVSSYIRLASAILPFVAIGLFHKSHREVYDDDDVKVTYALLCCTAVLEVYDYGNMNPTQPTHVMDSSRLSSSVAQYSLTGLYARNKNHAWKMCIVKVFGCKDFVNQHWCIKPSASSPEIAKLVLQYVKGWWKEQIVDAASYKRFNNYRGQWSIQQLQRDQGLLRQSLLKPFDESILLWHIATDMCFYHTGHESPDHRCALAHCEEFPISECATWCKRSPNNERAIRCREMSNYMIYLLFVNPEMLISGARMNLFTTAYDELEKILKGVKPPPLLDDRTLTQRIITKMQPSQEPQKGNIQDAWELAKALLDIGDEKKMWDVIEGVWVEMLCFSASRCRGYLHAKALGTGGELLTFVWLMLSYMGMETLPERLQRTEDSSGEENAGASSSTSQVYK